MSTRYKHRKKRKWRTWRIITLLILLVGLGGGSYFAYDFYNSAKGATDKIYQEIDRSKIPNHRDEEIEVTKDPFTVLIAGVDDQEGGARSDVLMLATVNPNTEKVVMLSIPRDTRTYIPSFGYNSKINHSYNEGIEATIEAVNELVDIPIDYYIATNFNGFEDIVDTLGGVNVDVPFTFKSQLTGSLKWKTYEEGEMELNGNEALAYVRMRKDDPMGDHGRNERQQQVIKALVDKAARFSTITKVNEIMDDLGNNVKTNIPPSKFLSYVQLYAKIKNANIENLTIAGYDEYINSVYYYIPEEESLAEVNTIMNDTLSNQQSTLTRKDDTSEQDTASEEENDYQTGTVRETEWAEPLGSFVYLYSMNVYFFTR